MAEVPQIQEKAPKPPGLLPKHVQTWLLVGLAFLMVAIMWLTGGRKPQTPGKTGPLTPIQAPVEVNETKIAELQNRIEELQRQQLAAQNALAQQTRLLRADSAVTEPARPQGDHPEDGITAERSRRAYSSLFASTVALSSRTQAPSPPAAEHPTAAEPANPSPENAEIARLLK